jgi:hypothetical protein
LDSFSVNPLPYGRGSERTTRFQTEPNAMRLLRAAKLYQKFLDGAIVAAKEEAAKWDDEAIAGKIGTGMDDASRKRLIDGNRQFHRNHVAKLEKERAEVGKVIETAGAGTGTPGAPK